MAISSLISVGLGNLITSGLEKITGKKFGRTTVEEFAESKVGKVLNIAGTGAELALGAASGLGIGKTIIAEVGVGLLSSSKKARKATIKELKTFDPAAGGRILGTAIETGKAPSIKKTLKKGGTVAAAGAAVLGGIYLIPKVKSAIETGKEKITEIPSQIIPIPRQKEIPAVPVTPQTETVQAGRTTRRKRRGSRRNKGVRVSQNVRVVVSNIANRKYKNTFYY